MGRIWESIEDVAQSLEYEAKDHDHEASRWQRVLDAKGDCSVISGWIGKMSIRSTVRCQERELAFAAAKRSAAGHIRDAIAQSVPLRPPLGPLSVLGDYTREQLQQLANLRKRAVCAKRCEGAEPYLEVAPSS
jgi:hypothetical protein